MPPVPPGGVPFHMAGGGTSKPPFPFKKNRQLPVCSMNPGKYPWHCVFACSFQVNPAITTVESRRGDHFFRMTEGLWKGGLLSLTLPTGRQAMDCGFRSTSRCFPCFSGPVLSIILIVSVAFPKRGCSGHVSSMTRGTSVIKSDSTRDGGGVFLMFFGGLRGI